MMAATLFSDISGFTSMSEELASDGPRGAEELNRVLLSTFTGMIDVIHRMGGAVSHFYGDAMSVYFPDDDGQAAERALACGQIMQRLMSTSLGRVLTSRPPGKSPTFDLTIKIGVGYGQCYELIVGSPDSSLEFVLAGPAVDQAAATSDTARASQLVASHEVLRHAGFPASFDVDGPAESLPIPAARPILDWSAYDEASLTRLITEVAPFLSPNLYERLTSAALEHLAEHRPVTSLFVQFTHAIEGEPTTDDGIAFFGKLLQQYYLWANESVSRYSSGNARLNRVLTGDKGNQLHIMFGAPVAPDAPEQAVRCALALQRERPAFVTDQRIGLATGKVFAGPVGSEARREYTVVGDVVNLSSRLVQVCEDHDVVMGANTAGRVQGQIHVVSLPQVRVKGKLQAVAPFSARSEHLRAAQLEAYFGTWNKPLVGRDDELDLLLGGMDTALRGIGGVAAVFGSTGAGKTHLLSVGAKYWLEAGGAGLVGECHPHASDIPFGPWRSTWFPRAVLT
jgi:class 3 adenylate cyclase